MRYALHAVRALLLKGVAAAAVAPDLVVMAGLAAIKLVLAAVVFNKTM